LRQNRQRNKENHAKRYAADPVLRQTKKALWVKRYAEDPVWRQTKKAQMAKRYAEDTGARRRKHRRMHAAAALEAAVPAPSSAASSTVAIRGAAATASVSASGSAAAAAAQLALRGLNVQWPFSQLLARGLKTIEVRGYPIAKSTVKFAAGEEIWLVETVGQANHGAAALHALTALDPRPSSARIVAAVTFADSREYAGLADFRADHARHCIAEGGAKDWGDSKPRFAWRVSRVRRLVEPIALPTKADGGRLHGQVGIHEPVAFAALFATDDDATSHANRPASGSCDDHVLYGGSRRLKHRYEYDVNLKVALVECHPSFLPTPAEFKLLLEDVPGVGGKALESQLTLEVKNLS